MSVTEENGDDDSGQLLRRQSILWLVECENNDYVKSKYGVSSWQNKLYSFLTTHTFEIFVLVLLCIDVVIVITELVIDIEFPSCKIIEKRDILYACCPDGGDHDHDHLFRFLGGGGDDSHGSCDLNYVEEGYAGCDDHHGVYETVHVVHKALFILSVIILSIFEVELLAKLALLQKHFLKESLLVADLIIVTVSLVLDIVLHVHKTELAELPGLLILFRLWRFVRIIHGVFVEVESHLEEEKHKLEEELSELKEENKKLKLQVGLKEN